MTNDIKTAADRIVEKHKRFHYGRRERTIYMLSLGHAMIEVAACIELLKSTLVVHPLIEYYNAILQELKSRIV